ncbi:MAG: hypothetical protein WCS43_08205 [Verrucomicrobiota bacterium]
MELIDPWLDSVEVRRLAELLMKPSRHPAAVLSEAGFEAGFLGYTTGPAVAVESQTVTPAAVQEKVTQAADSASAAEKVTQADPEPLPSTARGSFLDIIHHFRDWMREHFSAKEMFILDRQGEVIFDESHHGRLHFLARSLALAPRRAGSFAGYVHIKIRAGATLEVIPVETPNGYLILGAVVPVALSPAAMSAVMEAMILVAGAQTAPRAPDQAV